MRKVNALLSPVILILFSLHAVGGSFQLLGVSGVVLKALAWVTLGLIGLHVLIGVKLTLDTLRCQRRVGGGYFKENRLFWTRRLSGFAVMLLLFFHIFAFGSTDGGVYTLHWFTTAKLVTQLLLVAALAVHILSNVGPMLISLGASAPKARAADLFFVLSLLLTLAAAAFIVYYLRWNVW